MLWINNKTFIAKPATAASDAGNSGIYVDNEKVLATFTTGDLIKIYNANSDKPVKKFQDRDTALARTWKAVCAAIASTEAVEATSRSPAKVAVAAKKAASGAGRPRGTTQFAGKTLVALVEENPRRQGTKGHASFAILLGNPKGVPYEQYIEKGGRNNDLRWDLAKKWVAVK